MRIERLSTLYLILMTALALILGCHKSDPCKIKELRTGDDVVSYRYDDQNNISIMSVIDTVNHSKQTYKYTRNKSEITMSMGKRAPQIYYLDDEQRISSYSYSMGNVYEFNFVYDRLGRLVKAKKERFDGTNLFTTNHMRVDYRENNPVAIIDSCVLEGDYKGNGSNYVTRYVIAYYEADDIKYRNAGIFPILVNYLPSFNFVAYKGSAGTLPTKLIKSITQKTDGEPGSRKIFTYKVDDNGNVTEIGISFSDVYHKPARELVELIYQCAD